MRRCLLSVTARRGGGAEELGAAWSCKERKLGAEHLTAGWGQTCALVNNDGNPELYCWGSYLFGELGNGQISQSLQPLEIISTGAVLR